MDQNISIKDEDKILLLCARTRITHKIKLNIKNLLHNDLDWDYLTQRASQHKLLPLLYWNLKEFKINIPENIFNSLKLNFNRNAQNNLLMLGVLLNLVNSFEKQNVDVIPYKGPLLAISAYKNLVLRQFDDLDIFIKESNFVKVKETLISNGYMPQFDLNGFKETRFIKSQREYKFYNSETEINLEIQWKLQGVSFSLSDDLYLENPENIEILEINNKRISSISHDDLLLVLCIHASGHYWDRLSWICDVSELIQSCHMNWDYILKKADKLGIKRLLFVNLLLAVDLLDLSLSNDIIRHLKSKNIQDLALTVEKRIFMHNSDNFFKSARLRFSIREKKSHQIKDIVKIMLLPTNEEWNDSAMKSFLPPFSYFYRFIHVLSDY